VFHFLFLFVLPHVFKAPEIFGRTWGFHFITYYSVPVQAAFYACALAACFPALVRRIVRLFSYPFSRTVQAFLSLRKERAFCIVAVCAVPIFLLLDSKYALLGDNFGIVERVVNNTFMPDERGSLFVLHYFYATLNSLFSIDGINSIRIFSNLCGGVFIYLSLRVADELGASFFEKVSVFLFYVSFCTIQHFCGYVEVYAVTVMMVPAYLYASLLCLKGKAHPAVPAVILAGAVIMHVQCLMFSPVFIYVLYESRFKKYPLFRKPWIWFVAFLSCAVLAAYPAYKMVIPRLMPLASGTEMTMFSFAHLWEFLNGQLLGCGPGLFIAIGCLAYAIIKKTSLTPALWFMIGSSGFVIAGLFAFRSSLGSADWDIYSYSSLWIDVLAMSLFFHVFREHQHAAFRRSAAISFIVLMMLHSVPWILINASDKSLVRFKDIIKSDPAFGWNDTPEGPDSYRPRICRLAMRMQQNGLEEEACNLYKEAYETSPEKELNLYNYFVVLCNKKEKVQASIILDSLVRDHPASFLGRFGKILANANATEDEYLTMNVLNNLYRAFISKPRIIMSIFPRRQIADYFQLYTELLLKKKNTLQAEQVCRAAIAVEPRDGIHHFDLARVYFEKGEYDSVIAICSMLNQAFPGMALPNILGAQAVQRKQSGLGPLPAPVHPDEKETKGAGTDISQNEKLHDPIGYYERQLLIEPHNTDAHNNLGVALADKGQYVDAVFHLNEALRLNPANENIPFNLGNVYAALGRYEDAISQYREALRINPKFADAHNNLGNTLAQTGRVNDAIGHFKEAVHLRPHFELAEKNLEHALRIARPR
jgi:tetratricopeptide (TPR) repeat protein